MKKRKTGVETDKWVLVSKMLELKLVELKILNQHLTLSDLVHYLLKVIFIDKAVNDISETAYYIFNIKVNRIVEFLNSEAITRRDLSLDDFKDMFIK